MKGSPIPGPIRGPNPCNGCTERFTACSDRCPKDKRGEYGRDAYKAEIERVKKNQRDYTKKRQIGWEYKDRKG